MKRPAFVIFAAALLAACTGRETDVPEVEFRTDGALHVQKEYLALDVPDDLYLGTPDQIAGDDRYIYILYTLSENAGVYIFDKQSGGYVAKAGRKGRGGGEYILPLSMTLHGSTLYVVDGGDGSVLRFRKGDFVFEGKTPSRDIGCFEFADDSTLLTDNPSYGRDSAFRKKSFLLTDTSFVPQSGVVDKIIVSGYSTGPVKPIYAAGDKLRAYTQFLPYVYEWGKNGTKPVFGLSFEGLSFPPKDFMRRIASGNKDYSESLRASDYISYHDVYETDNAIASMCIASGNRYLGIFDRSGGGSCLMDESEFAVFFPAEPFFISGTLDDGFAVAAFAADLRQTDKPVDEDLQEVIAVIDDNDVVLCIIKVI